MCAVSYDRRAKALLSAYKGNEAALVAMTGELERMRTSLLASSSSDQNLAAFEVTAEALLDVLRRNRSEIRRESPGSKGRNHDE